MKNIKKLIIILYRFVTLYWSLFCFFLHKHWKKIIFVHLKINWIFLFINNSWGQDFLFWFLLLNLLILFNFLNFWNLYFNLLFYRYCRIIILQTTFNIVKIRFRIIIFITIIIIVLSSIIVIIIWLLLLLLILSLPLFKLFIIISVINYFLLTKFLNWLFSNLLLRNSQVNGLVFVIEIKIIFLSIVIKIILIKVPIAVLVLNNTTIRQIIFFIIFNTFRVHFFYYAEISIAFRIVKGINLNKLTDNGSEHFSFKLD